MVILLPYLEDIYCKDSPGETFRVLKEKEEKKYGEYRTRRLVLEAWDNRKPWGRSCRACLEVLKINNRAASIKKLAQISPAKPSVFSKKKRKSTTANTAPGVWYWRHGIHCKEDNN
jgi:hypothetical protein